VSLARGRSDTERSCRVQQEGSTMCRKVDARDMMDTKKKKKKLKLYGLACFNHWI